MSSQLGRDATQVEAPPEGEASIARAERYRRRNPGYHGEVDRLFRTLAPSGGRVLELGCRTGRLLAGLRPSYGLGIDIDPQNVRVAREIHRDRPELEFEVGDAESADWSGHEPFDTIVLSDLVFLLDDVQATLARLHEVCTPSTRLLLNYPSNVWRPLLTLGVWIGRRDPDPRFNWLSTSDLENLLRLADFEVVTGGGRMLLPLRIPLLSAFLNRFVAKLPVLRMLCLTWYLVARPRPPGRGPSRPHTVSVMIPTLNERGNIEGAFTRTPVMGEWTELVFVDGGSTDGTPEEIDRCIGEYGSRFERVVHLRQEGRGKGQAVRQGFAECRGDIIMILDSDLTMPPEDLPKYYDAIAAGHGELINGCRLVYPMDEKAMRFLNMLANHLFAVLFTWLLDQPIKDTLCGTKVLWRRDYEEIAANRDHFGDFDPFGDFDLLFGAARLNRKIVDLPIRYRDREYGEIEIHRWQHGLLLFRMCGVAFRKLKLS